MYKRTVFVYGGQQAVAEMLGQTIVGPGEDDRINSRMIKFSGKTMKNDFKEYEFR